MWLALVGPDAASLAGMAIVHMRLAAGRPHDDGRVAVGVDRVLQLGVGRAVDVHHGQAVALAAPEAEIGALETSADGDLQRRTPARTCRDGSQGGACRPPRRAAAGRCQPQPMSAAASV